MLVQLKNLTHYYGKHRALDDVSLDIEPGAIGLIGQNGAGKSTLMQILLGLIRPTKGEASVLGMDVRKAGRVLRGRVGFMPERDALIPGLNGIEYAALAGELCGMPRKQAMRRAHETLSYLDLGEARYRKVEQYSVGMKQRLKLAATIVHDPDVLLLDEPTSGLDPEGRAAMLKLLAALAARPDKSLILSSHLLGDIERVCEWAIIMDQGRIVRADRVENLRTSRTRSYRIRWKGDGDSFLESLRNQGAELVLDESGDEAMASVPEDWSNHEFFATAQNHHVVIVAVEPEEDDLEAVYHRLIESAV